MPKLNESPTESIARAQAFLKKLNGPTETDRVIEDVASQLKELKKLLCRKCQKPSDSRVCDNCKDKSEEAKKVKTARSGKGYQYVYDADGKMVPKARFLMEQHLGRKLGDHMAVTYRDGNKNNCVLENLVVVFKTGTPLDFLTCKHCGVRGQWDLQPPK